MQQWWHQCLCWFFIVVVIFTMTHHGCVAAQRASMFASMQGVAPPSHLEGCAAPCTTTPLHSGRCVWHPHWQFSPHIQMVCASWWHCASKGRCCCTTSSCSASGGAMCTATCLLLVPERHMPREKAWKIMPCPSTLPWSRRCESMLAVLPLHPEGCWHYAAPCTATSPRYHWLCVSLCPLPPVIILLSQQGLEGQGGIWKL